MWFGQEKKGEQKREKGSKKKGRNTQKAKTHKNLKEMWGGLWTNESWRG